MFGLKLVNKKSYLDLHGELDRYKKVLLEKESIINNLEGEIKGLHSEISRLEKKVNSLEVPKKSNTILLTDVAETPLIVEKKTRTIKGTTGVTRRRKAAKAE